MNIKQIAFIGAVTAAVAKFYFKNETKTALILGAVAIVTSGLADNVFPDTAKSA
jgi:hypothetical protein